MVMTSRQQYEVETQVSGNSSFAEQDRAEMFSVAVRRQLPGFLLDVAFAVPPGLTVFFGPSGAGKSMTLQTIAGLFPMDHALIRFGKQVWHDSARRIFVPAQQRHIGYVPQNYALFPHLTVEQNIAFGIKASRIEKRQRAAELVSLMRLDGLEKQHPAQLSGGQQQRVALARALATHPQLLLLDEPFSSLDAPVREALRDELRALQQQVGIPIMMVTHDAQEASALADTMVVINQGRVLQTGSQEAVFRSPCSSAVARLVGMHTCWQGTVTALYQDETTAARSCIATIEAAGLQVQAHVPRHLALTAGQSIEIGIRTDEVRFYPGYLLANDTLQAGRVSTIISGVIIREQFRRIIYLITVRLDRGQLISIPMMRREYREQALAVGNQVTLELPADAVHIFDPPADPPAAE
jgi:ABC-type sulfate/molybdate transport systems ATPase subunit